MASTYSELVQLWLKDEKQSTKDKAMMVLRPAAIVSRALPSAERMGASKFVGVYL